LVPATESADDFDDGARWQPATTPAADPEANPSGYFPRPHDWEWDNEKKERKRLSPLFLVAMGVAILMVVTTVAVVLMSGDEPKRATGPSAPSGVTVKPPDAGAPARPDQPAPTGSEWTTQTARPVGPDRLVSTQPRNVTVGGYRDSYQVTWEPPANPDKVSGYIAIAQTPAGSLIEHVLVDANEHTAVFSKAPAGSCFVVTTLIGEPDGVRTARGEPMCPVIESTAPSDG